MGEANRKLSILLVILADISYLGMLTSNLLSVFGVYGSNIGDQSDKYYVILTPTSRTFLIWNLIFILTAIYLIVLTVKIFLNKIRDSSYLIPLLIIFIINMICNGLWVMFWSQSIGLNEKVSLSICLVLLVLIALTNFSIFIIIYRNESFLGRRAASLGEEEDVSSHHHREPQASICCSKRCYLELLESIVNLGWISIYWSWTVFAMLINGVVTLKYTRTWPELLSSNCVKNATTICHEVTGAETWFSLGLLAFAGLLAIIVTVAFSNWAYSLTAIWALVGLATRLSPELSHPVMILMGTSVVITIATICSIGSFISSLVYSRGAVPTRKSRILNSCMDTSRVSPLFSSSGIII